MNLHVVSEKDRKAGLWQGYSGTTCVPDCTHLVIASCTSDEAPFLAPPSARKLPTTTTTKKALVCCTALYYKKIIVAYGDEKQFEPIAHFESKNLQNSLP